MTAPRSSKCLVGLVAITITSLALFTAPAYAHDDAATLAIEAVDPAADGLTVRIEVSARYSIDQELVEDADPVATATGPGGATLAATPLTAVPETVGLYAADLVFPEPGAWSVTVASTEPAGTITTEVEVVETEPSTTTVAEETATTEPAGPSDGDGSTSSDGGTTSIALGVVAVLAVLTAVAVYSWRRGRGALDGDDGEGTTP